MTLSNRTTLLVSPSPPPPSPLLPPRAPTPIPGHRHRPAIAADAQGLDSLVITSIPNVPTTRSARTTSSSAKCSSRNGRALRR